MIHHVEEGGVLQYGLNIETVRNQGYAFVLFWRGLSHVYGLRLRLFRYWRRPLWSAWRVEVAQPAGGTCPTCGFFNHPESNMRDAGDDLVFCANCQHTWRTNGLEASR